MQCSVLHGYSLRDYQDWCPVSTLGWLESLPPEWPLLAFHGIGSLSNAQGRVHCTCMSGGVRHVLTFHNQVALKSHDICSLLLTSNCKRENQACFPLAIWLTRRKRIAGVDFWVFPLAIRGSWIPLEEKFYRLWAVFQKWHMEVASRHLEKYFQDWLGIRRTRLLDISQVREQITKYSYHSRGDSL